ncbi:hypothetical protein [Pseudonocardia sp. MH-G8]|uniref:hypothetical protein n=1 Tax=Pseudonocardia sp. MH-G8 TaxID=1854588 RepID=UPI000BA1301C|nr:hypothetical protein [Pseudonocardia sp. MH-G8]OZM75501.1 hypothetical protein CFP66_46030 [Pseudonocardia sp. MH-G8]
MTVLERPGAPARAAGRTRAFLILVGVGGLLLVVAAGLIGSLPGLLSDERARPPGGAQPAGETVADSGPSAEAALARAPMLDLPPAAASPHTLSARTAGPPITLPEPAQVAGSEVPTGFPPTPEGALAQLAALMTIGMAGGDPQTWAWAYRSVAEDGAAPAGETWTGRDLVALRRGSDMAPSGPPPPGMTISWTPTGAMVKGTAGGGSFTVACVLGEFVADYNGRVVNAGWGNCLPMRLLGGRWRIASGPTAAAAPSAWPGSAEAVAAGWREIRR